MIYRRRATPLHAAGAGAGLAYCVALGLAALVLSAPLALGAVVAAIVGAALLAGTGRELGRAALFAVPLAVTIAVINALVTRDGLTVIVRLGNLPILGHTDVTLEALAYGGVLGLRAMALVLCAALYTAAVDPDEVLRLMRRVSFRSALTATLATRLVPVLSGTRAGSPTPSAAGRGAPPTRVQLLRATTSGVLDRALDVAAALEVRGYGAARRPARTARRPRSRHDLSFGLAAAAIAIAAVAARAAGAIPFSAYPSLHSPLPASELAVAVLVLVAAWLPFADRRGVRR